MPLRCSLTTPILFGGVPRALAIANGTLAAAVGIGFLQLRNIGRGRHSQAGVLNEEAGFSRSSFHVVSRQQTPAFHSTPPPGVWGTLSRAGPLAITREERMKEPMPRSRVVVLGRMTLKGADHVGLVLALAKLILAICLGVAAMAFALSPR